MRLGKLRSELGLGEIGVNSLVQSDHDSADCRWDAWSPFGK